MASRFFIDGIIVLSLASCETLQSAQLKREEQPARGLAPQSETAGGTLSTIVRAPDDSVRDIQSDCVDGDGMMTHEKRPSSEVGLAVPVKSRSSSSEKPYWFTRYRCH